MKEIDFSKLQAEFPEEDLEWRIQRSGIKKDNVWAIVVPYITNRAIQQRLDDVCGPLGWWNQYCEGPQGGILCGITITQEECVSPVTKWDGAENTHIEAVKGGLSDSMKRAAVQWGIGRYLYEAETAFAIVGDQGKNKACHEDKKTKEKTWYNWSPPKLTVRKKHEKKIDPLSFAELSTKLKEAKAFPHLKNTWSKYQKDINALPADDKAKLEIIKDEMKESF